MSFTYTKPVGEPDYTSLSYALYKVRVISRDTRNNPPFSLTDEEWLEFIYDSRLMSNPISFIYQPYKAVYLALSTNPERLTALTEASGTYSYVDINSVKQGLLAAQQELNNMLGVSRAASATLVSVPVFRGW